MKTINELKSFCAANNIVIEGDRRLKATYTQAISAWESAKVAIEDVKDCLESQAVEIQEDPKVAAVRLVSNIEVAIGCFKSAYVLATSDEAKRLYVGIATLIIGMIALLVSLVMAISAVTTDAIEASPKIRRVRRMVTVALCRYRDEAIAKIRATQAWIDGEVSSLIHALVMNVAE